jgi:hypothetical protein
MNYLKIDTEVIDRITIHSPRLEMQSTKSIFTTSEYYLSPKRSNHCGLLPNEMFFFY